MARALDNDGMIHELARYQVRPEALDRCLAAIQEFVEYDRVASNTGRP